MLNVYTLQASEKQRQKFKSILDWIKLLTATLKQKPFQFEISVQSVPSSWNGINESILSSSSQANTQVTSLHLLIVGHKANKLFVNAEATPLCPIRLSTCCLAWQLQWLLTLSFTITRLFSVHPASVSLCSTNHSVNPLLLWTNMYGSVIIKQSMAH